MAGRPHVLVLGGGPDSEREVSIKSSGAIAQALRESGRFEVSYELIHKVDSSGLRMMAGDVIFPYLHGPWGEGGGLQDLLEVDGRPFVGTGARAARTAMDKMATKIAALGLGIATPWAYVMNAADSTCPVSLPAIVKPVHEGSTIGLHVCADAAGYGKALSAIMDERRRGIVRAYMVEPKVAGRELTVGVVGNQALPVIEIVPASGLYDYEAKYTRDDTRYDVDPQLPAGVGAWVQDLALRLHFGIGCRHISRTDFMLDASGTPWLLEINTTPGFTDHSLVPKAARHAGIEMAELCGRLVDMALGGGAGH